MWFFSIPTLRFSGYRSIKAFKKIFKNRVGIKFESVVFVIEPVREYDLFTKICYSDHFKIYQNEITINHDKRQVKLKKCK